MMILNSRIKSRNKKAFTLIELLVVIAIIALLLAVLLPSLQQVKEISKAVVCASNLKQWNLIISFFAADNGDRFPDADWDDDGKNDPRGQWWFLPLRPYYIDQPEILICKKASQKQDINSSEPWVADGRYPIPPERAKNKECWGREIIAPTHPDVGKWVWSSYAPNSWIMDPSKGRWGAPLPEEVFWGKFITMSQPSQVPIFLDCRSVDAWPHDMDRPDSKEDYSDESNLLPDGQGSMRSFTMLRHKNSINGVFGDGHVTKIRITEELWGLKWHREFNTGNELSRGDYDWPSWMR